MKVISPSEAEVIKAAAIVGLTGGRVYHTAVKTFNVLQFEEGSQGFCRDVALYSGPCFVAEIPRLISGGCCSSVVVRQLVTLALIGGVLYEVDFRRGGEDGKVSVPSDVKLFNSFDGIDPAIRTQLKEIRKTLRLLEEQLQNQK